MQAIFTIPMNTVFDFCLNPMNTKSIICILIFWLNIRIQPKSFILHLWNSNTFIISMSNFKSICHYQPKSDSSTSVHHRNYKILIFWFIKNTFEFLKVNYLKNWIKTWMNRTKVYQLENKFDSQEKKLSIWQTSYANQTF